MPSLKLVTANASATVKSAKYWLNVTSCTCRNTRGWYVSVEKAALTRATTSDTPPASSLDSVVCSATWMRTTWRESEVERSGLKSGAHLALELRISPKEAFERLDLVSHTL